MGRITMDLIRKRAEHNEGEVQSLEEISLHQEKIERIELLEKTCRDLRILLLQNNSIPKIENLGRLKRLEYLNLAMNLIERVEGLGRCESLKKLDLMLNFIGDLSSIRSLQDNVHLEQLFLTGNPCVDFPHYREFVIAILPQLRQLDGLEVSKSERICARQAFVEVETAVLRAQEEYFKEKVAACPEVEVQDASFEEADNEAFWSQVTDNSPNSRREMNRRLEEQENLRLGIKDPKPVPKQELNLTTKEGQPRNVNQAKLPFSLKDEEKDFVLDLAIPKHLCTSLIELDVGPGHVTVWVKGKAFQLVLPEEVRSDAARANRSQTTGYLVITMPKVKVKRVSSIIDLTTTTTSSVKKDYSNSTLPPTSTTKGTISETNEDENDDDLPPPLI